MYALTQISDNLEAFRQVVENRQPFRPLYVKIKLNFGCNLRCEMCNHWRETRPAPLPVGRFIEILSELAQLGCQKIHFSGGEPLLRPQVPELVAHASSLGMRVTMTTNGTLVDKAMAKALVQSGLRGVNLSLDSPDRKTHDRVRGVPGAWKKTTRAIGYFSRYAHKGKLTLRVNTVVSRSTYATLAPLPDMVHALGADSLNLIAVDPHCGEQVILHRSDLLRYNSQVAPQIAERGLALGLLDYPAQAYPFGVDDQAFKYSKRGYYAQGWYERHPCFAPWTHSLIDYDGKVYVCCMTREAIPPLGDLREQSFMELWQGAAYQAIRQQMHPPALTACKRCDDFLVQNRQLQSWLENGAPVPGVISFDPD